MVAVAADYRWSSHAMNAYAAPDPRITPHPSFTALGVGEEGRAAYRALFAELVDTSDIDAIRTHTQQQRAWGSERFRQQIEALTQRASSVRPRGRPWPRHGNP